MAIAVTNTWLTYSDYRGSGEHSVTGQVLVLPKLYSPQLDNERDLLVYLPPSYQTSVRRYPVLYMQDGQNLFDRGTGFAGEEWQVDESLEALSQEGLEAIVVALPHMGEARVAEYNPFAHFRGGCGERYLAFLVETVKPLIDRVFRTRLDRGATGLLGSSMGGLISLYGFFRYPHVFGRLGSLSPALWYADAAIYGYVERAPFAGGRLYLDHGTRENSAARMFQLLRAKGYQPGQDLLYVSEPGGEHSETAWARRLPAALRFLLQA